MQLTLLKYLILNNLGNLLSSDLVLFVEPYGKIDEVVMYETAEVGFSIRYKECLYEGINCVTSFPMNDIKLTFQLADEKSWALEVKIIIGNIINLKDV